MAWLILQKYWMAMQVISSNKAKFLFSRELVRMHYFQKMPEGLNVDRLEDSTIEGGTQPIDNPTLFKADLLKVLDWLHALDKPSILEEKPCSTPLLLYDKNLSFDRLLFHYDGNPASAQLIKRFLVLFEYNISKSSATIISPSFIPKAKLKEEQELIQLITKSTAEASFIKFNFNRIGDFWSYAVQNQCTLLITTKNYQADLAKVLFHFYKGGMWYDRLSFFLGI